MVVNRFGALIVAAVIALASAPPARALNVGDTAPLVHAQSTLAGKIVDFDLQQALKKSAVVLYYFPKAFTSG